MASLRLLHTADMHNRLRPAAARRLRELREENGALLLDTGDAIGAINVTVRPAEPIIDLMNAAGYTAMAVGNREYFFRKRWMIYKTKRAEFSVLCANLRPLRGDMGHIQRQVIIKTSAGDRVGLFGLTPLMIVSGSWGERLADLRFMPGEDAGEQMVAQLRGQGDWLVALSHLGKEQDRHLVELFPEIDLLLSGHSHPQTTEIEHIAGSLICRAAPYAREAVLIEASRMQDTNHYETSTIKLL